MSIVRDPQLQAADCSIFERALDALPDGVLLVNADRKTVYTNAAFKRLWNMPETVLASGEDSVNLRYVLDQLVDPESFLQEVERLHPTTETSEDEIHFRDGRTVSRRSLPFQENGKFRARIWIFTDVTEAKNATVDHLTGLPNRRCFARDFPAFVSAPPDGLIRSVGILDIDNFKRFNDHYGHARGDQVLGEVGLLLKAEAARTGELVFRIGGEEFLMGTRTRNSAEARKFFESVCKSIAALNCEHAGNSPHGIVTVSIGFGSFRSAPDAGAVFDRVDKALYKAKASGRNRLTETII